MDRLLITQFLGWGIMVVGVILLFKMIGAARANFTYILIVSLMVGFAAMLNLFAALENSLNGVKRGGGLW